MTTFHVDGLRGAFYLPSRAPTVSRREDPQTPVVHATFYGLTDRGRTREHNEDTFLVADLGTPESVRISLRDDQPIGERGFLYLVADGMGGAAAGEIASEMAATTVHRHMVEAWSTDPTISEERFAWHLREALERANAEIHAFAADHPDFRGMGTTATVAGVHGSRLFLAQIGDSRGYLVRDGEVRQLTRDQSLTQRLVDVGELTEEEAEASDRRNIILQALGPDALVRVDLSWQSLQRGDLLILCSDGLSTVVRRHDIARLANEEPDVAKLCERLVALANEAGGPDNITVVAVRFDGDGLPERANDEPGYHALASEEERPALLPTHAFPAIVRPKPVVLQPPRRGSPTTLALLILAATMVLLAGAIHFFG